MELNDFSKTIIETADGSKTISIPQANLSYHSKHGALAESNHVYIQNNLLHAFERKDVLDVLEIGFGTGLNALLTLKEARKNKKKVNYHAIEPYPVSSGLLYALDYPTQDETPSQLKDPFLVMHECVADQTQKIDPFFEFIRIEKKIQDFESPCRFDVVYFDAFAPLAQPEIWTESIFIHVINLMLPGGTLSTYSSKSSVRRAMESAGFEVKKIQGPFGKREIVLATKPA